MAQHPSPFDDQLTDLTDVERRAEAARERLRQADRALVAALSGTFAGTLTELAETRAPVQIRTRTGTSLRGTVVSLGPEVLVISTGGRQGRVIVRISAIETLIEHSSGHDRETPTSAPSGPQLAELLDEFGQDRQRLALTLASGNRIMGTAKRVGVDQIIIRLDGDSDTATVPLYAIDQVAMSQ